MVFCQTPISSGRGVRPPYRWRNLLALADKPNADEIDCRRNEESWDYPICKIEIALRAAIDKIPKDYFKCKYCRHSNNHHWERFEYADIFKIYPEQYSKNRYVDQIMKNNK